jgi:hypothetical protein
MKDGTGPAFFRQWKESQGIHVPPPPSEKKETHLAQPAQSASAPLKPTKDQLSSLVF